MGFSSGVIQISGSWAGQIEFEVTVDNVNWLPRNVHNGTGLTNATAGNGIFTLPLGPFASVRVRSSVFLSGAAAIFFRASHGNYYPQ